MTKSSVIWISHIRRTFNFAQFRSFRLLCRPFLQRYAQKGASSPSSPKIHGTSTRLNITSPNLRRLHNAAVCPMFCVTKYRLVFPEFSVIPRNTQVFASGNSLPPLKLYEVVGNNSGPTGSTLTFPRELDGLNHIVYGETDKPWLSHGHWGFSMSSFFRIAFCGSSASALSSRYFKCVGHAPNCPCDEPSVHVTIPIGRPFSTVSVISCELDQC